MIRCGIQYEGSPEQKLRGFKGAVKAANIAAVRKWHARFLPLHFTGSAAQTYGYRKRTPSYQKRKARSVGHQRPLELTGQLKAGVTRQIRVSGTSRSARGRMNGARVANFHADKSPTMRDEITAVTQHEADVLAREHASVLTGELDRIRTPETARS